MTTSCSSSSTSIRTRSTTASASIPAALGLPDGFDVVDGLTGETYTWGERNYVRLGPGQAHVLEVRR